MPGRNWPTHYLRKILARPIELAMSQDVSRCSGSSVKLFDRPTRRRLFMEVERTATGFNVYIDRNRLAPWLKKAFVQRASPVLTLLRRPDCIPTKTRVRLEDGYTARNTTRKNVIAFCASGVQSVVLIPDHTFLTSQGYNDLRRWTTLNWREWNSRSDTILWRGATTGSGRISGHGMTPVHLIPRVQLCLLAKDIRGTDMKIANIVQSNNPDLDRDRFVQAGIMGERLPVEAWAGHKFAIDIDGNTNSFGTMLRRLLLGCCVFKVGSAKDWRQWYYESMEPWVHFIPIQSDLSDLAKKIEWCREHDQECKRIATDGRAFATSLDCEAEEIYAVQRINAAFTRPA